MCDGRMLWGIIGALTLTSPLLILLTQASHCTPSTMSACCRLLWQGQLELFPPKLRQQLQQLGNQGMMLTLIRSLW